MCIVLASVLKSSKDVRLYHKIAQSIHEKLPDARIEVWGQGGKWHFSRLSWKRFWINITFFLALWRAKPDVVIVATFELLPAGVLYKWIWGGKLGYDVQENYAYNVRYTHVFPYFMRAILAFGIRSIERLAMPFIDFCWVAEECYLAEMPFLAKKAVFLPNKVSRPAIQNLPALPTQAGKSTCLRLLYSGNVSADYGVFEGIQWVADLQKNLPALTLHLIGHCPQEKDKIALEKLAEQYDFLTLQIDASPIPHEAILEAMQASDWLLMPYRVNKSVAGRIPTKFYEALALGKNMLITQHNVWQNFMAQYPEAVVVWVDFQARADLYTQKITDSKACYPKYEQNVFWEFPTKE